LHQALLPTSADDPTRIEQAVSILDDELGLKQARAARSFVVKKALGRVDTLGERAFLFVWRNLSALDEADFQAFAADVGKSAWSRDPSLLLTVPVTEAEQQILVAATVRSLPTSDLIAGIRAVPSLCGIVLTQRPEILERVEFWAGSTGFENVLRDCSGTTRASSIATAVVLAGRDDLARPAVASLGPRAVLTAIKVAWEHHQGDNATWLGVSAVDSADVAAFLTGESSIPKPMLDRLSRAFLPDAIPNSVGQDPWVSAWEGSVGMLGEPEGLRVAAYFFARALGTRSRSCAELARLSFELIHTAAELNRLPEEAWRLVEPRLLKLDFWLMWDRCRRLTETVAALFVEGDLSPETFAHLVESPKLFRSIAYAASRRARGRAYLAKVHSAIGSGKSEADHARSIVLDEVLDSTW
jgi:hypothetical protein